MLNRRRMLHRLALQVDQEKLRRKGKRIRFSSILFVHSRISQSLFLAIHAATDWRSNQRMDQTVLFSKPLNPV
jgi:hypothetical protein